MSGDAHVRICESLGVQFPRATRLVVKINGEMHYLWRAVDHEGEVLDFLVQPRRCARAQSEKTESIRDSQRTVVVIQAGCWVRRPAMDDTTVFCRPARAGGEDC
jgi:transposase-like protein